MQLWGGWNGRDSNPNMEPEKAKNFELILMQQWDSWLNEISIYSAQYENVVKEEAENAGTRKVLGIDYRGKFNLKNFIKGARKITGYVDYTHIKTKSSVTYDHTIQRWVGDGIQSCLQTAEEFTLSYDPCTDFDTDLGDIAPHKLNLGVNVPLDELWNLNLSGQWVSDKKLYLRNPLRDQGRENQSYLVANAAVNYINGPIRVSLRVKNLFDEVYYHSGVEGAESGDDFSQRSQGWRNSLIPQVSRNYMLSFDYQF